ncbi:MULTISPECIES: hypothetical protein [Phytobacter]|uniref:Uncharacterized protein n=1 Tax=Phytobacter diazotrophicus TaxID=395631 RepID=A0ABM7VXI7_9ENTR|nr:MULTISPECIES: hypothetical protein [Phytobacter]BBE78475.1 hypothetical protein MRY16398_35310 [Phytobacter sp. MRY16-398]BDD51848.1 hypothetical protein PDTA9734_33350 [Phytobacter diazotrophicus]BEG82777.1 hypothetical protein PDTA9730_32330 [Phytobacter diazotrophicus]BEG88675.1 hypothetical protein PDTA9759_33310 [Phytobacter diazotrophicus]BEG94439.1 hypothetical protein PDTA9832_32980 [Phytobacter diazotrophicus]
MSTEKKYCYRYVDGNDSDGRAIVMLWKRVIIRESEKTFWHTDDMPNMDLEQLVKYRTGGPKERRKYYVKRCLKGAERSSYHYTKEEALTAFVHRKLYQLSRMTLTAETVRLCLKGLVNHGHISGDDDGQVTRFSKIIATPDSTLIAVDEPGPEASTYSWGEY